MSFLTKCPLEIPVIGMSSWYVYASLQCSHFSPIKRRARLQEHVQTAPQGANGKKSDACHRPAGNAELRLQFVMQHWPLPDLPPTASHTWGTIEIMAPQSYSSSSGALTHTGTVLIIRSRAPSTPGTVLLIIKTTSDQAGSLLQAFTALTRQPASVSRDGNSIGSFFHHSPVSGASGTLPRLSNATRKARTESRALKSMNGGSKPIPWSQIPSA